MGFSDQAIYPKKKITIKAYDDEERSYEGTVILPIRVDPMQRDTMCQVFNIDLTYNIILGHPWIHEMQAVPFAYHKYLKFPYNRQEISISIDTNPFQYCNAMEETQNILVPHNMEAQVSSSSNHQEELKSLSMKFKKKMKIKNQGMGEYSFEPLRLSKLPTSPRPHGKPPTSRH